MIDELRPYEKYNPMQERWLGATPQHWELLPNRSLFEEVNERGYAEEPLLSVTIGRGVIRQATLLENSSKKDSSNTDKSKYKLVRPGYIAYNKMRAWQGALGISEFRGIVSPAYIIVRPRGQLTARYCHYLFRTPGFAKEAERWSYGITSDQWSLRSQHFKCIYTPVPPPDEQAAIVKFLGHANRKIGRYIQAKRKLIKLLEEQKQVIIHRAVTQGLDPNVRMKPSGVDWLGDVPEHWEVLRARYLFREHDERSKAGAETHLSMSQKLGLVPSHLVQRTLTSSSYAGGKLCDTDDLVLNRLKAHLGVFALAKQPGVISPDYTVLRPRTEMCMGYFEQVLRSPACRRELRIRAKGIVEGFWRLYTDDFNDIWLPVPPVAEQHEIYRSIDDSTREIRAAIEAVEREIALIREYRTRLTSDVVTGKLDVREAAAKLPEITADDDLTEAELNLADQVFEEDDS